MSEETTPIENENENENELKEEEEENVEQEEDQPFSFSEEVSPDELDIDLDSLKITTPSLLGKPKPKASLTTAIESKKRVGRPPKEDEGLWSWCEEFNYTPGVEFLKLYRLWPKQWEGVAIGGFVEEIYEPIDEHWLIDRWGGGNFQVDAYQKDTTGRTRKSQTKMVEISGLPKAYIGSDGEIHLFSTSLGTQSNKRSADVLRRRVGLRGLRRENDDFEEDNYESDSRSRFSNTQRASHLDQPLTDASTLYKAIQENKKSENEALGVLREAQKDNISQMQQNAQQQSEMYKTLLEQQKEEMNRLREESRRQAESSSAPFKEMLHILAAQGQNGSSRENLEVLRSTHDSAIKSLTREHSQHLDDLRKGFENRQNQLMDELNRLRTQFATDTQRIRTDYLEKERNAKDDAFRTYQLQLDSLKNQSSELRERHRDELSNITRDKNETINQLRQELMEFRTLFQTKDSEQRSAILEERQRAKEEFEKVYTSRVDAMKESYQARLDNIQNNADLKVQSAEKEAKVAVETMREKMDQSINFAKKEAKSDASARIVQLEAQLESLRKEYADKEKLSLERSKLEQENAQRERENQRLILESTAQSRQALEEMTRQQLESKIRELNTQVKSLEKQNTDLASSSIPESNDPFEQLEKLNAIKSRLKQHGFISETDGSSSDDSDDEKEEKPKDFLGKILHYGPQFVGPILQRIDNATAVAQQAVDQQQQQELLKTKQELIMQQQNMEQERQLAVQRETSLRERRQMLEDRRRQRELEIQQEQQRIEMAQELERARQEVVYQEEIPPQEDIRVEPENTFIPQEEFIEPNQLDVPINIETPEVILEQPIGESEMDSESDEGYLKLADYLSTAISEKKKAKTIVNELKMARMMNMFSAETLKSVISQDFDTLVQILSSHHPSLKSPKARLILKDVLKGMA